MYKAIIGLIFLIFLSCKQKEASVLTAQQIIDRSIEECGGALYTNSNISFNFRDKSYVLEAKEGQRVLKRIFKSDSSKITDIRGMKSFERYVNDSLVVLHDTIANKYANSVNSVHYFAYLPYGLNDPAVNKELLGKTKIKDKEYYKIKVTFNQQGGGDDYDDTYVYWFNAETFEPDYLAYEFHVDGGGMRFRESYNERNIGGIRFVDYKNYKSKDTNTSILKIDSLFTSGNLEFLSKIELDSINVRPGSYN